MKDFLSLIRKILPSNGGNIGKLFLIDRQIGHFSNATSSERKYRVTGELYLSTPDGHRTTAVVGMSDMLNLSMSFCSREKRGLLGELCDISNSLQPDELREMLDSYLRAETSRKSYSVASCFTAALAEKHKAAS